MSLCSSAQQTSSCLALHGRIVHERFHLCETTLCFRHFGAHILAIYQICLLERAIHVGDRHILQAQWRLIRKARFSLTLKSGAGDARTQAVYVSRLSRAAASRSGWCRPPGRSGRKARCGFGRGTGQDILMLDLKTECVTLSTFSWPEPSQKVQLQNRLGNVVILRSHKDKIGLVSIQPVFSIARKIILKKSFQLIPYKENVLNRNSRTKWCACIRVYTSIEPFMHLSKYCGPLSP